MDKAGWMGLMGLLFAGSMAFAQSLCLDRDGFGCQMIRVTSVSTRTITLPLHCKAGNIFHVHGREKALCDAPNHWVPLKYDLRYDCNPKNHWCDGAGVNTYEPIWTDRLYSYCGWQNNCIYAPPITKPPIPKELR